MSAVEKAEKAHSKEYEKILKVCNYEGTRWFSRLKQADRFGTVEGGPSLRAIPGRDCRAVREHSNEYTGTIISDCPILYDQG